MIPRDLVDAIMAQYALPWKGRHGVAHWARVLENGRRLAEQVGAKLEVVEFFAVFHDSRRFGEKKDPGHGKRGAVLAAELRGSHFDLSDGDFALLTEACELHTDGHTEADVTIQTCWDSDRLDLGRIGREIDKRYLCTEAAKADEMIAWANDRSRSGFAPSLIAEEWGLSL